MTPEGGRPDVLETWRQIPDVISRAIAAISDPDLDLRSGPEGWSTIETIHHLVEANLVACTLVVAALGESGCTFDWSRLNPDRAWMARLGYDRTTVAPALELLRALTAHVSGILLATEAGLQAEVKLVDSPGAEPRTTTIHEILEQETVHVREHLREIGRAEEV